MGWMVHVYRYDLWDGWCMYIGMICGMDGACI